MSIADGFFFGIGFLAGTVTLYLTIVGLAVLIGVAFDYFFDKY